MKHIPQSEPWTDEAEALAVSDYLQSGGWLTEFKQTRALEARICEFTGARFCTMVTSGTAALYVALAALRITAGDEVVVPDFSMIASANAVVMAGADPIFADVEPESLCLDLDALKKVVTSRTKAVMLVSLNGRYPRKVADLISFCRKRGLMIVEDAAQSLGSFHGDRHVGRLGKVGIFSFSAPKIITTGQGGALITDDAELHARITSVKDFGRTQGGIDIHPGWGFNFKFTDLQAVVGIAQMQKLPARIHRKKEIYARYADRLDSIETLSMIPTDLNQTTPWFIDVMVPDRDELQAHLKNNGIGSRPVYPPIHSQPVFGLTGEFPVTEKIAARGLWLPSSSKLSDSEIDRVCDAIEAHYRHARFNDGPDATTPERPAEK